MENPKFVYGYIERNGKIVKTFYSQAEMDEYDARMGKPLGRNPAPYVRRNVWISWLKRTAYTLSVIGYRKV